MTDLPAGKNAAVYSDPHPDADALAFIGRSIRAVPDFPKPGILFRDITPLLADATTLRTTLDLLQQRAAALRPTRIVGIESRGFVFGVPLADRLQVGFAPVRKPGKLPHRVIRGEYALEYGAGTLELHEDAVAEHDVLIVDDLLATGGTAACAAELCTRLGARVVGYLFVIELAGLNGRARLPGDPRTVQTLLTY
jgi:adenine phosphoribosyltransferase